jgi:hypothetical protein
LLPFDGTRVVMRVRPDYKADGQTPSGRRGRAGDPANLVSIDNDRKFYLYEIINHY